MGKISSTYVPSIGNPEARVWLVGEAPGKDEERQLEPFVGRSGQFLTRYLSRIGFSREQVYLTNLCHYRPYKNRFSNLADSPELKEGLEELSRDLGKYRPNVIIALGAKPLSYLTDESKIFTWRGSFLPCTLVEGLKVLPTFHPAFVVRPQGFKWHPIFHLDLQKAVKHSDSPDLPYPEYESIIDPPRSEAEDLVGEILKSDWLSVDIETFPGGQLSCIGFADSPHRGVCFTFESIDLWHLAEELMASPVPKIFQYGNYDINFLTKFYGWETNAYEWDTFVATSHILPEFPRGLDFLTSIYTTFPYYKEERKEWKEDTDMTTLWEYNIKDCIATYLIAMEQMRDLERIYG